MALSSDLMGLGVSPLQAARTANGGTGPVTIAAAGTSFAGATRIGCTQYFVSCANAGAGASSLALPVIGGDNGALVADDYIVNNASSTTISVFASTSVAISVGGSFNSTTTIAAHTTTTFYALSPASATVNGTAASAAALWIAVKGS